MRFWAVLLAAGLLTGCVNTAPDESVAAPKTVKKVSYLTGKTQKQVKRALGAPAVQRAEEPNQLWAYYDKGCSTLVFFDGTGVCQHAEQRGACEKWYARVW